MGQRIRIFTVAAIALVVAAVLVILSKRAINRSIQFAGVMSQMAPRVPAGGVDAEKKEDSELSQEEVVAQEISFKDVITFEHRENAISPDLFRLVVDGTSRDIQCPSTMGFLALAGGHKAYLQCRRLQAIPTEFIIAVSYFNRKGVRSIKDVFQYLTYEGATADRRSWILRNPKTGEIRIETASFVSVVTQSPIKCERSGSISLWNADLQEFVVTPSTDPLKRVKLPILAAPECLQNNGEWKER